MSLKFMSWNVNGIRACAQKTFFPWFEQEAADFVCLQETKAHPDQLTEAHLFPRANGSQYQSVWASAEKKGYSGVAIYFRKPPEKIIEGLGVHQFDREGRTLTLEYPEFVLVTAYFPNGQPDLGRVPYKLEFSNTIQEMCLEYVKKGKQVIICGDFNTAHQPIDLFHPRANENSSGFTAIERAWLSQFIEGGFVDIFRKKNSLPHQYTWWTYRQGARQKNVGWRIDYFFVNQNLESKVLESYHQPKILGSDHCPVGLTLSL